MVGVTLGFFIHALFFPDVFSNGIFVTPALPTPDQGQTQAPSTNKVQNITTITFDGQNFSRHNVAIEQSRYIVIVNTSKDTLMWLSSNNKDLATPRGYGEGEQVKTRLDDKGQFIVADKNNPSEKLIITVK